MVALPAPFSAQRDAYVTRRQLENRAGDLGVDRIHRGIHDVPCGCQDIGQRLGRFRGRAENVERHAPRIEAGIGQAHPANDVAVAHPGVEEAFVHRIESRGRPQVIGVVDQPGVLLGMGPLIRDLPVEVAEGAVKAGNSHVVFGVGVRRLGIHGGDDLRGEDRLAGIGAGGQRILQRDRQERVGRADFLQTEFHGFVGIPVVAVHVGAEQEEIDVVGELVVEPTVYQVLTLQPLERGIEEVATLAAAADSRTARHRRADFLRLVDRGWRIGRRVLQEDQVALIVELRRGRIAAADDAAQETGLVQARIPDHDVGRRRSAKTLDGIVVPPELAGQLIEYTGSIVVFITTHDVATAAKQIRTSGNAQAVILAIVELRNTETGVNLEAGVVGVGNEVHHAGDGVRTVNRGHAAGHHVDPFEQHRGNEVGVDLRGCRGRRNAAAVEQHQRPVAAEVAERQLAGAAVAAAIARAVLRACRCKGRHF